MSGNRSRAASVHSPRMSKNQEGHGGMISDGMRTSEELLRASVKGRDCDCHNIATQLEVLRMTFDTFDRDGDGLIDIDEFHKITSVLGLDMTKLQAEDLVHEVDADGSGTLGFDEFIVLMGTRQDQTTDALESSWQVLDPDGVGSFKVGELKELILKSGILLDCWELKEMVEIADLNKDGLIDRQEFMQAAQALPWQRCSRLGEVQQDIMSTWKMLDAAGTGHVSMEQIRETVKMLGCVLTDKELKSMFIADDNKDGLLDYQEFAVAYHSKQWRRARLLAPIQRQLRQLRTTQERNYAAWHNMEIGEARECGMYAQGTVRSSSRVTGLMERRALQRDRTVRGAVAEIWETLAGARRPPDIKDPHVLDWVEKDLFVTMMLHTAKFVSEVFYNRHDDVVPDEFFVPAVKSLIEEEWADLVRTPVDIKTVTLRQKSRANLGDLRWMDKPEGWSCIGYAKFFGALFEVVDSEVGFGENVIKAERYAAYMNELAAHLVVEKADGCYHWMHPELVEGSCPASFEKVELSTVRDDVEIRFDSVYYKRLHEDATIAIQRIGRGYLTRKEEKEEKGRSKEETKEQENEKENKVPSEVPQQEMPACCASLAKSAASAQSSTVEVGGRPEKITKASFEITKGEYNMFKSDFEKFDLNGNGSLDHGELRAMLHLQLGREPTESEFDTLIKSMDFNADGRVSLEEYIKAVYSGTGSRDQAEMVVVPNPTRNQIVPDQSTSPNHPDQASQLRPVLIRSMSLF